MSDEQNSIFQGAISSACLAGAAYIVYSLRAYKETRHIDLVAFFVGLASSALVGTLVSWALEGYHVNAELSAVATAMAGYCGGTLLDTYYSAVKTIQRGLDKEIRDTLHTAGETVRKKVGKNDKNPD